MEMIYIMVVISLGLSFGFLAFFFWALDNDQLDAIDTASWNILNEDKKANKEDK